MEWASNIAKGSILLWWSRGDNRRDLSYTGSRSGGALTSSRNCSLHPVRSLKYARCYRGDVTPDGDSLTIAAGWHGMRLVGAVRAW